ncbi:MAG TPA: TldD/PmbA family protein [Candidatus Limnocylindrales bacterium]|nr:TldD/PmbA family protein [Candidatus Limnocylindrales bacterium]
MTEALFGLVEREVARRGGGQAELYAVRERVRRYDARGGGIDSLSFADSLVLGVRIFRNARMGFSYGFRESGDELARMVEAALFCADASDPDPAYGLPGKDGEFPEPALYDAAWESVGDSEKAEFAAELERRTLAFDPRMKRVRSASLKETITEVKFRNSAGSGGSWRASQYVAYVESVAEQGEEGQTGFGLGFGRRFADLSADVVAEEAGRRAVRMLGARRLPTGRYAAVLENGASAELLEVLIPSFLASQVAKGKSMLEGKQGQKIASLKVRICDDPLDPQGSGSQAFDGEGSPCRRNVLVEKGVLKGYLADAFWGRKLGTDTTASCCRPGPKSPPAVGISNLLIDPGDRTPKELLREAGSGILLTEFLGIHTADPVSGDFSVGAAGIRFERGEEKEPVRGFAVSGNILSLLLQVKEAGSDFRWFGNVGSPSLAISEIAVGGE